MHALSITMIELGLARISRLLQNIPLPWRAIHVAGTNGKGSVCAYASTMLTAGKVRCGRFTSPHLIDRWDCIAIDDKTVDEGLFREVEACVHTRNERQGIEASEFEILTATAFEIFAREKIELGIIEVGLGGRHDATNILRDPVVTVITKIGKDHEIFLGDSLEEIAYHKAGIMKKGVPCVVDATNPPKVLFVLEEYAKTVDAGPIIHVAYGLDDLDDLFWRTLSKEDFEPHQQINLCLAIQAVRLALSRTQALAKISPLIQAISKTVWPGRLQHLSVEALTGRGENILLDGAHNVGSAEILGSYVDSKLRDDGSSVTWMLSFSRGKNVQELLSRLLRPGDILIASKFGPVDGMPWVQSVDVEEILRSASTLGTPIQPHATTNVDHALRLATQVSNGGPVVVAGSLYQVSDVLRLLRKSRNV